jgi:hypothetical protein
MHSLGKLVVLPRVDDAPDDVGAADLDGLGVRLEELLLGVPDGVGLQELVDFGVQFCGCWK